MFDFEKLDVYKKAKAFNSGIRTLIRDTNWTILQEISSEGEMALAVAGSL